MANVFAKTLKILCLLSLTMTLGGCFATTRTTVSAGNSEPNRAARCAGWRFIKYDGDVDTLETINQVRTHNAVGERKRCWKER